MIPYGRQSINEDDIKAVEDALRGDFLTTGPLVEKFEHEIEKVVGAPSIVVSSGTAALHCAYAAIGIEPGDEVITPPITFVATQATAALFGAKIVFADVLPDTANINPTAVEAAITRKTKAIVAVDYAGHPADMDELRNIADKHGIFLIEDAAHSIGSTYRGKKVGSLADITTFSFFPTKNMTTGEGGAVSSSNSELLDKARKFSRQGLVRDKTKFKLIDDGPWHQEVHEFGLNYRLPDILCALGISQISRLQEFKARRRKIFRNYSENLMNQSSIRMPTEKNYVDTNWHLFPIRVEGQYRKDIFNRLRNNGVAVQVNYIPAYWHPAFDLSEYPRGLCPEAELFYREEISLPMFHDLSIENQEFVISLLEHI
ncbi:WecE Predicted pyridoxal phosphate-dependent enzyme apparently involved in regulation of cell wall biogenesis [Candidatus Nanopelagicaceae bacterium]